jgi:hypothetical protein
MMKNFGAVTRIIGAVESAAPLHLLLHGGSRTEFDQSARLRFSENNAAALEESAAGDERAGSAADRRFFATSKEINETKKGGKINDACPKLCAVWGVAARLTVVPEPATLWLVLAGYPTLIPPMPKERWWW